VVEDFLMFEQSNKIAERTYRSPSRN